MLGPVLGPGYLLTYDMVWVPDLALRADVVGLGSGLPRAVPSDAVVAVVDEVVPGMLLQKLVLLGCLVAAGAGAAALARALAGAGTAAQCVVASLAVWNPFVVERLGLGHWPVLAGYAALPWLVLAARRRRLAGRTPLALWWLLPVGALSASAGLASAVVVLAVGLRGRWRPDVALAGMVVLANLPWLAAGVLRAGAATSDADGGTAFATRAEGALDGPLTALGLGGVWNSEVVPPSREGALGVVALLVLVVVAGAGVAVLRRSRHRRHRRDHLALAACWALGWLLAAASALLPDELGRLAAQVPGGGLLRDGSRLLGLCVPALVVAVAAAADALLRRVDDVALRALLAAAAALVPVLVLPDAAWGVAGALRPHRYPDSYAEARDLVGDAGGHDALVLPFSPYRAPAWNGGRAVLDPLGRFLRPETVVGDDLVVSGRVVDGEDPRADDVDAALASEDPASALAALGIGVVVTDPTAPGEAPGLGVDGERVGAGSPAPLLVTLLPDPAAADPSTGDRIAAGATWALWCTAPVAAAVSLRRRRRGPATRREHARWTHRGLLHFLRSVPRRTLR